MGKISCDPYLFFKGNCREAMEFYKNIFGGKLFTQSYEKAGMTMPGMEPSHLMHASLTTDDFMLMASDTAQASPTAAKVSISLSGDDEEKLTAYFNGLSEDVEVTFPLKKESWGDTFGSVTDKYGVEWMINISSAQ